MVDFIVYSLLYIIGKGSAKTMHRKTESHIMLKKIIIAALLLSASLTAVSSEAISPKADEAAVVIAGNARFTVLTPQLIRMEWSADGCFEDNATLTFVNRRMPVPEYKVVRSKSKTVIRTSALTLTYRMTLTDENAQKTGEQSFSVNGGNVTFGGASGASVDVSAVKLTRTVYTVTYTDGVADSEIFADQAIKVLAGRATPAFDGTPTRDGYTFAGWSPAVSDTVAGDVTYTAQWTVNGTSGSSGGGSDPTPRPTPAPTPTPAPVPEAPGEPESEIPDADVPLNDSPDVELPEEDLPLAAMPGEELIELPEEEIPLAEVPKTGDNSGAWGVMALLAACGLAGLAATKKRKNLKEEEG